mgnify:CR=1 FL=1
MIDLRGMTREQFQAYYETLAQEHKPAALAAMKKLIREGADADAPSQAMVRVQDRMSVRLVRPALLSYVRVAAGVHVLRRKPASSVSSSPFRSGTL